MKKEKFEKIMVEAIAFADEDIIRSSYEENELPIIVVPTSTPIQGS